MYLGQSTSCTTSPLMLLYVGCVMQRTFSGIMFSQLSLVVYFDWFLANSGAGLMSNGQNWFMSCLCLSMWWALQELKSLLISNRGFCIENFKYSIETLAKFSFWSLICDVLVFRKSPPCIFLSGCLVPGYLLQLL